MKCLPGDHDPNAEIDENMRCSVCGRILSLDVVAFDSSSPIAQLTDLLFTKFGVVALAVQFFAGSWQAGVRTPSGIGPTIKGTDPNDAIVKLVHHISEFGLKSIATRTVP